MSYASAAEELRRNGWEIYNPAMITLYSYFGRNNFMRLMENDEINTDLIARYLEEKTGEKIRGTPLYNLIGCISRSNSCKGKIMEIFNAVKAADKDDSPIELSVVENDESQMQKNVEQGFAGKNPIKIIEGYLEYVKDQEGKALEFGAVPYQFPSSTKAEKEEFEQLLREGNKLLEDKIEVTG